MRQLQRLDAIWPGPLFLLDKEDKSRLRLQWVNVFTWVLKYIECRIKDYTYLALAVPHEEETKIKNN